MYSFSGLRLGSNAVRTHQQPGSTQPQSNGLGLGARQWCRTLPLPSAAQLRTGYQAQDMPLWVHRFAATLLSSKVGSQAVPLQILYLCPGQHTVIQ